MKAQKLEEQRDRLVGAVRRTIESLENPISFVWPANEDGEHLVCFTPSANPEQMLVVVNANQLIPALLAAVEGGSNE